jgi:hypothetical protein
METHETTKAISEYQTQKTIRFGLTVTNENLYSEEIRKLLETSEEKIKQLKKAKDDTLQIQKLRCCLDKIKEYLKTWNTVYSQIDFLAVTKDYYKVLERKGNFNGFWIDIKNRKQPQSSEIKLSSLQSKYNDKKRFQYILDFWKKNTNKIEKLFREVDNLLKVFEQAKNGSRTDLKLNEVELRKTFLSLFNLVNESLKPLVEGNLFIINDDKIDESNTSHKSVFDFISKNEDRQQLYECICNLRDFFKDNGGYVPFGRATLNKWTALQKSNYRDNEIDSIIKKLKINDISSLNVDYMYDNFVSNFEQVYKDGKQIWQLKNNVKSVIELCQFFKYKKIPINARLNLAKRLGKDTDFLKEFGVSKSPALDYKNDKGDFNLADYPLKVAFDYAWENCAKAKYETITFPENECKNYLKNVFNLDVDSNTYFDKYALLLRLKVLIGRIKSEETTRKENIEEVKKLLNDVKNNITKEKDKTIMEITNWLTFREKQINKKEKYEGQDTFSKAMQVIGAERGGLKSRITKYKTLTEIFKVCASEFGRQFATLRDYFTEAYEVNKIEYRAWIVEDEKQNRFVLFVKKDKELNLEDETNGQLKLYEVKSLTSKSLIKFIKNKGAYPDFHSQGNFNYDKIKKDWQNYQKNQTFLQNLKSALTNSKMAIDQNWSEFNFDFSQCDTYEKIEKEIDRKGYKLVKKSISTDNLKDLVEKQERLLLPIVNQDINKENKQAKNQFTKDWTDIFDNKKRLHPEFNIFYRFTTKNYPNTKFKNATEKSKRYSRFQMLAHFGCEIVPQGDYLSKKEQIVIFTDDGEQKKAVKNYNKTISNFDYIIGIDRGIKQLATLCVIDKSGVIQGDFQIYTRTFNKDTKQWEHSKLDNRNILDLSNLRVETTIDGEKVLVDLASIKTKNGENQQKIKLKQLAYIRELQYAMQTRQDDLLNVAKGLNSIDDVSEDKIKNFIAPYKEGTHYADLPKKEIFDLLKEWQNADDTEKRKIQELDPADNLKSGIVANMVGVVAFLCEKYDYKVRIALEDLTSADFAPYPPTFRRNYVCGTRT